MKARLLLLMLCLCTVQSARAELIASVEPKSAGLSVLDGSSTYLSISYFAWGPYWSGVSRKAKVTAAGKSASFVIRNSIKRTSVDFSVSGTWTQQPSGAISLQAALQADGQSEIVMAQFGLTAGPGFAGGRIETTNAAGQHQALTFPPERGVLGDDIREIRLTDAAGTTTALQFKQPARVTADRQELRIVLARERVSPENEPRLAFDITLPQAVKFIPDLSATGNAFADDGWYEFKVPDRIPDDSVWQMRDWLEKPAGKHGRILRQGDKLMYNGAPIKLWGITDSYDNCAPDAALADKRADFYSALGINAVRLHKFADGPGWQGISAKGSHTEFDPAKLDRMDYFVAALKKQGL